MDGRIVTCVYCGQEYPDGTHTSGATVLTEHIKVCEKHPMRDLEQQLTAANARISELKKLKPSYKKEFDCMYQKFKAEEKLSAHYKLLSAQAEEQVRIMREFIQEISTMECSDGCRWNNHELCLSCQAQDILNAQIKEENDG